MIDDQMKWDGKGSPPGAVEKGAPPTINTALTDWLIYKLIVLGVMFVSVLFCALGSSLMAKG